MIKYKKYIKGGIKFISIFITFLAIALVIYGITNPDYLSEEVSTMIYDYGTPALFAISILLDLIPQIISPMIALGIGVLAGININLAVLATILGSTVGSLIGFYLGKKYMMSAVDLLASQKSIDRLTRLTNKYGKIIVPLAAVSPLPYLPVLLGAINFSKRNFLIYGLLPRAIGIMIFGYVVYLF